MKCPAGVGLSVLYRGFLWHETLIQRSKLTTNQCGACSGSPQLLGRFILNKKTKNQEIWMVVIKNRIFIRQNFVVHSSACVSVVNISCHGSYKRCGTRWEVMLKGQSTLNQRHVTWCHLMLPVRCLLKSKSEYSSCHLATDIYCVHDRFSAMAKTREMLRDGKYSECVALVRAARYVLCMCVCTCGWGSHDAFNYTGRCGLMMCLVQMVWMLLKREMFWRKFSLTLYLVCLSVWVSGVSTCRNIL